MSKKTLLILILPAVVIAITGWLGVAGLQGEEPRRALVSIEMMKSGEYIFPHMFGWMYYNKPPFFNWVMIGIFQIMGTFNEWAVRLPSILALLLLSFLNWRIVRQYINPETAVLSSLFILTNADTLFYGTLVSGEIDLLFSLIVYLQVMTFFVLLQREQFLIMFLVSYFFAGIGFLTKGLPALPFQFLTIVATLILFKKWRLLFSYQHLAGILIFLLITVGYIMLLASDGQELPFIIRQFKEASQRTGLETPVIDTVAGTLIFPFRIIYMLMPYTLFFGLLLHKKAWSHLKKNKLIFFSIIFILINIPIYWFTGDFKGRYIYPFIPFICIILGYLVVEFSDQLTTYRKWIDRILSIAFIVAPFALTATFFIPDLKKAAIHVPLNIFLILFTTFLAYLFFKFGKERIYLVVLLMITLRFGMNNTYVQALKNENHAAYYSKLINDSEAIMAGQQIFMSGPPFEYESEFSLGPIRLDIESLKTAPYIAFQIPYYITLKTDKLVLYEEQIKPGKRYLIQERYVRNDSIDPLLRIKDYFIQQEWVLIDKPAN
jgi:4-amino-4-deoxy-L-arabinose transferase-like glycosyltransferase